MPLPIAMRSAALQTAKRCYSQTAALAANPKVFFEIDIADKPAGRITFELFADTVPKTVIKVDI
jgi:hypothetical protein